MQRVLLSWSSQSCASNDIITMSTHENQSVEFVNVCVGVALHEDVPVDVVKTDGSSLEICDPIRAKRDARMRDGIVRLIRVQVIPIGVEPCSHRVSTTKRPVSGGGPICHRHCEDTI